MQAQVSEAPQHADAPNSFLALSAGAGKGPFRGRTAQDRLSLATETSKVSPSPEPLLLSSEATKAVR